MLTFITPEDFAVGLMFILIDSLLFIVMIAYANPLA